MKKEKKFYVKQTEDCLLTAEGMTLEEFLNEGLEFEYDNKFQNVTVDEVERDVVEVTSTDPEFSEENIKFALCQTLENHLNSYEKVEDILIGESDLFIIMDENKEPLTEEFGAVYHLSYDMLND